MIELAHICFQVTSLHKGHGVHSIRKCFDGKSISRNPTQPWSLNLQASHTGVILKN